MFQIKSMSSCPACDRARGDLLKPDLHAAGAAVLLSALVQGHTDDNPKYKFTHMNDGRPAVTSTDEVDKLLAQNDMEPIPLIPFDRIMALFTVMGMQLNTHYMHLPEYSMCKELAGELFNLLDINNNNDR